MNPFLKLIDRVGIGHIFSQLVASLKVITGYSEEQGLVELGAVSEEGVFHLFRNRYE